jgi:hypothetical protein
MKEMVGPNVAEHAKARRCSTSMIYKMTEPSSDFSDSGTLNDVDRLALHILTALGCSRTKAQATAPTQCLAHMFDQVVIDIPRALNTPKQVTEELARTIAEFSDVTAETARALEDGRISAIEAERIHKEVWQLIRAAVAFEARVQESVK